MVLEEKETTDSGSSMKIESPPPVSIGGGGMVAPPEVVMNLQKSLGQTSATVEGGGRGGGGGGSAGGGAVSGSGGDMGLMIGVSGEKRRRGRPRKYDSEGNLIVPLTTQTSSSKRGRGRPSGSGNCQFLVSFGELLANTAGWDFTPHVLKVLPGEDVAGKILSIAQKGPRGLCVISANGTISSVTIRQPGSSGGILTFEGLFEILSLTGSSTVSENDGMKSRTGGLSVTLSSPDGRVIGGGVAGLLLAASPIQMVLGSFMPNGSKTHKRRKRNSEPRAATVMHGAPDDVTVAIPALQAPPESNISLAETSHIKKETNGEADNSTSNTDNPNSTSTDKSDWNDSVRTPDQRRSTPDINVSVTFEKQ
ncbi:hypothetical protein ACH5RR_004628 [Cinchona calisaya]|uniref:AT-hook motif nuclear-localized protein n=1 Tax=Cinchona calisaya TaxID=153742 RepID=A0ABD3AY30_9GENT